MYDEINSDILRIIYRYEWQLKINEINKEYHLLYKWVWWSDYWEDERKHWCLSTHEKNRECDDPDNCWENGRYCINSVDFNHRYLDDEAVSQPLHEHLLHYTGQGIERAMSPEMIGSLDPYRDGEIMAGNPKFFNYIYTSTKYLRQIKESGIECLIK